MTSYKLEASDEVFNFFHSVHFSLFLLRSSPGLICCDLGRIVCLWKLSTIVLISMELVGIGAFLVVLELAGRMTFVLHVPVLKMWSTMFEARSWFFYRLDLTIVGASGTLKCAPE